MRIATRLWSALFLSMLFVLGAGVWLRHDEEQRSLLEVTMRDRRFFAHALHTALSREQDGSNPLAAARAMLDQREVAASHIVATLVSLEEGHGLPGPRLDAPRLGMLRHDEPVVVVQGDEILTYIPVSRARGPYAVELREPQAVSAIVAKLGWRTLLFQAAALAVVSAVLTRVLVGFFVSKPLERLAGLARTIARGDLQARVEVDAEAADEVSELTREMNQMADQLLATRRALDESDAERAAALEQLRHADRLRTVGQLASSLAHELGTPLNVVSGHARAIEDDPSTDAEVRASASAIVEQSRRMTGIIRNLLDFARRKGRPGKHSLVELVRHAAETMAPLARRHRATFEVRGDPTVVVDVDRQQLMQVVTNLVANAMQSMPDGGPVELTCGEVETAPPVGVHGRPGRYAFVTVGDRGEGIAEADLPHLFEPFFTRKEEGEGTGLGLSVVEGIVREHGGFVTVKSERGVGTKVTVHLPRFPQARPSQAPMR